MALSEAVNTIYTSTGAISITGVAPNSSWLGVQTGGITRIGTDGAGLVTNGDIFIGATGSDIGAVDLAGTENTLRTTGNITVRGNAPSGIRGLVVEGSSLNRFVSSSGNVSLTGITAGAGNLAIQFHATAPTYIGWDGTGAGTTGNISILGQTPAGSTVGAGGITFGAARIKGTGALLIGNTPTGTLSGLTLGNAGVVAGSSFTSVTLGSNASGTTGAVTDLMSFTTQAGGAITVKGTGAVTVDTATLNSNGGALTVQSDVLGQVGLLNSAKLISNGGAITVRNTDTSVGVIGISITGTGGVIDASNSSGPGGNIVISGTGSP